MADRVIQIPGYQLLRRLHHKAGVGTYLAIPENGPSRLLLKVFMRPSVRQADYAVRFKEASDALSRLRHRNIARVHDGGVHGATCYLAMEHVGGAERMDEWAIEAPLRLLLQQVADAARALHFAHSEGFVHGGLEAAKILVQNDQRVLLTGFDEQLLPSGVVVEDLHYLAPECYQGEKAGPASDIYSIGMLLYCLLAQHPPGPADFAAAEQLKSVAAGVPAMPGHLRVMQPIINQCLAPEPAQRFSHAGMLADAIEAITDEDLEAIQIATPHYLARLMRVRRNEVPQAQGKTQGKATPQQALSGKEQGRHNSGGGGGRSRKWPLLLVCALVLAAGVPVFWEQLPLSTADLLARSEFYLESARDHLSRLTQGRPEAPTPAAPSGPPAERAAAELEAPPVEYEDIDEPQSADIHAVSEPPRAESPVVAEADPSESQLQQVDEYIAEGDRLLAKDALTLPDEANALAAYRQALVLDPGSPRAWAGLQNIVRRYIQLAQIRIDDGEWSRAGEFVGRGLLVDPNNRELLSLQSRLTALAAPPDPGEVEAISAAARVQMVRENYVTPAGDSAYDHYSRLLLLDPDNPEARSGLARVERELGSEIELQVNRNRFSQAQALLVKAQDAFPASQRFHRLALALEAAMQSEQNRRAGLASEE